MARSEDIRRGWNNPILDPAGRVLPRLVQGLTAAGGLILAAWWITQWTAPRPVAALPGAAVEREAAPDLSAALRVLGQAGGGGPAVGDLRLTGVYASTDGRGFATFITPRGPVQAQVGSEVAAGIVLREAGVNHVVLSVNGVRQQMPLRTKAVELSSLRSPPAGTRGTP